MRAQLQALFLSNAHIKVYHALCVFTWLRKFALRDVKGTNIVLQTGFTFQIDFDKLQADATGHV